MNVMDVRWVKNRKGKIGLIILVVLLSLVNGRAGARIILRLARDYVRKRMGGGSDGRIATREESFRVTLYRLQKQGLVEKGGGFWKITFKGKEYLQKQLSPQKKDRYAEFKKQNAGRRDTIIIFDIPESEKKKREYLRHELVLLGYEPVQKSVWIGGGPLPKEFLDYLKIMNILPYVHIFSIKDRGTID